MGANVKLVDEKGKLLGLGELTNDGSLIASKSVLGNVIVGDNINVTDDGTISVKSINKDATTGIATIDTLIQGADTTKFVGYTIGVANQTGKPPLQIRKATDTDYGVVKVGSGLSINNTSGALETNVVVVNLGTDPNSGADCFATEEDLRKALNAIYGYIPVYGKDINAQANGMNGHPLFGNTALDSEEIVFTGDNPITDFDLSSTTIIYMGMVEDLTIKAFSLALTYPQTNE